MDRITNKSSITNDVPQQHKECSSEAIVAQGALDRAELKSSDSQGSFWPDRAMEKMVKNAHKAVVEHQIALQKSVNAAKKMTQKNVADAEKLHSGGSITLEALTTYKEECAECEKELDDEIGLLMPEQMGCCATLEQMGEPVTALTFSHTEFSAQGPRSSMEDAHYYKKTIDGFSVAIFDGHGGSEVSAYAAAQAQERFFPYLEKAGGNVHAAFTNLINDIHSELNQVDSGSTAVMCYVDKKSNLIYTATLGDSEAFIYRKVDGKVYAIPLSCVRDWSSHSDAARAAKIMSHLKHGSFDEIFKKYVSAEDSKKIYFPARAGGVNVARAIGDSQFSLIKGMVGVSQKPKITVNQLRLGDKLVLGCDGLFDYTDHSEIINALENGDGDFASRIGAVALEQTKDNVSVIVIDAL